MIRRVRAWLAARRYYAHVLRDRGLEPRFFESNRKRALRCLHALRPHVICTPRDVRESAATVLGCRASTIRVETAEPCRLVVYVPRRTRLIKMLTLEHALADHLPPYVELHVDREAA